VPHAATQASDTTNIDRNNIVIEIISTLENREAGQKPLPFYFVTATLTRWPLHKFDGCKQIPARAHARGDFCSVSTAAAI
jgi:hypothetical protein